MCRLCIAGVINVSWSLSVCIVFIELSVNYWVGWLNQSVFCVLYWFASLCQLSRCRAEESWYLTPHTLLKSHCAVYTSLRYLRASQGWVCVSLLCWRGSVRRLQGEFGKLCKRHCRVSAQASEQGLGLWGTNPLSSSMEAQGPHFSPTSGALMAGWGSCHDRGGGSPTLTLWLDEAPVTTELGATPHSPFEGGPHRQADTPVTIRAGTAPRQAPSLRPPIATARAPGGGQLPSGAARPRCRQGSPAPPQPPAAGWGRDRGRPRRFTPGQGGGKTATPPAGLSPQRRSGSAPAAAWGLHHPPPPPPGRARAGGRTSAPRRAAPGSAAAAASARWAGPRLPPAPRRAARQWAASTCRGGERGPGGPAAVSYIRAAAAGARPEREGASGEAGRASPSRDGDQWPGQARGGSGC